MKLAKSFRKLIQLGLTLLSATLLTQDLTYAQRLDRRPGIDSLFSESKCNLSGGYGSWLDGSRLVTIQRQTFTPFLYLGAYQDNPAFESCLVSGNRSSNKTLTLKFGIEDGENRYINGSYQVTIYLDGQVKGRTFIVKGDLNTVVLDISKTRSIGIEVNCSEKADTTPWIHFVGDSITTSSSKLPGQQENFPSDNSNSQADNPALDSDANQFPEDPQPSLTLDDAFNVINQGLQIWQRFKN